MDRFARCQKRLAPSGSPIFPDTRKTTTGAISYSCANDQTERVTLDAREKDDNWNEQKCLVHKFNLTSSGLFVH